MTPRRKGTGEAFSDRPFWLAGAVVFGVVFAPSPLAPKS